jgi:hypothetical protein
MEDGELDNCRSNQAECTGTWSGYAEHRDRRQ